MEENKRSEIKHKSMSTMKYLLSHGAAKNYITEEIKKVDKSNQQIDRSCMEMAAKEQDQVVQCEDVLNSLEFTTKEEKKVVIVKECSYGLEKKTTSFFLCSCFGDEFKPICSGCITRCHKDHDYSEHIGYYDCRCVKTKHKNVKCYVNPEKSCIYELFKDFITENPMCEVEYYNENGEFKMMILCYFCTKSSNCLNKIEKERGMKFNIRIRKDSNEKCSCVYHPELNIYKLNEIFNGFKDIMKKSINMNANLIYKSGTLKEKSLDYFSSLLSEFLYKKVNLDRTTEDKKKESDKELEKEDILFFGNYKVFTILNFIKELCIHSNFINTHFDQNGFMDQVRKDLQRLEAEDVRPNKIIISNFTETNIRRYLIELFQQISELKSTDNDSVTLECYLKGKVLFVYFIYITFFHYQLITDDACNLPAYAVCNMTIYQRYVYLIENRNFNKFSRGDELNSFRDDLLPELELLINGTNELLEKIENYDNFDTGLLLYLVKIIKKLIKRNLISELQRKKYLDHICKIINGNSPNSPLNVLLIKTIFYSLITINDVAFIKQFREIKVEKEEKDYCFVSNKETNTISTIFLTILKTGDNINEGSEVEFVKKNAKKVDFYVKKILSLLAGNSQFYSNNILNNRFMDDEKFRIFRECKDDQFFSEMRKELTCDGTSRFYALFNKFSNDLQDLNQRYFNYEIKSLDQYICEFNMSWSHITKQVNNWIPLTKKYHSIKTKDQGEAANLKNIKVIRDAVKHTSFYNALNGFLNICAENKRFSINTNKKGWGDFMSFMLYFLFLLIREDSYNLVMFSTLNAKNFINTFQECNNYFYCFLEVIVESYFGNINLTTYKFDNFFFYSELVKNLIINVDLNCLTPHEEQPKNEEEASINPVSHSTMDENKHDAFLPSLRNFAYALKMCRKPFRLHCLYNEHLFEMMQIILAKIKEANNNPHFHEIINEYLQFDQNMQWKNKELYEAVERMLRHYIIFMNELLSSDLIFYDFLKEKDHYLFSLDRLKEIIAKLGEDDDLFKCDSMEENKKVLKEKAEKPIILELVMIEHHDKRSIYPKYKQSISKPSLMYFNIPHGPTDQINPFLTPKTHCQFETFENDILDAPHQFFQKFNPIVDYFINERLKKFKGILNKTYDKVKSLIRKRLALYTFFENVIVRPSYYIIYQYLQLSKSLTGTESFNIYQITLYFLECIKLFYTKIEITDIIKDSLDDIKLFPTLNLFGIENIHLQVKVDLKKSQVNDILKELIENIKYFEIEKIVNIYRKFVKLILIKRKKPNVYETLKIFALQSDPELQEDKFLILEKYAIDYRIKAMKCVGLDRSIINVIHKSEYEDFSNLGGNLIHFFYEKLKSSMSSDGLVQFYYFKCFNDFFSHSCLTFQNILKRYIKEAQYSKKENRLEYIKKMLKDIASNLFHPAVIFKCRQRFFLDQYKIHDSIADELVNYILKFYQNLCEGHNLYFQNMLFNLTVIEENDIKEDHLRYIYNEKKELTEEQENQYLQFYLDKKDYLSQWNEKHPNRKIFLSDYFEGFGTFGEDNDKRKIPYTVNNKYNKELIKSIAEIEENKFSFLSFLLIHLKVILYNCKLNTNHENLLYERSRINHVTPLCNMQTKICDLIVEMIQTSNQNNNRRFYYVLSFDKELKHYQESILEEAFYIIKYFKEMDKLFNEKFGVLQCETIKAKLSLFHIVNNFMNQNNKENKELIKLFLSFFPIDDLYKYIVFYFKVLYMKYLDPKETKISLLNEQEFAKRIEEINFTQDMWFSLCEYYTQNLEIYEDDFFKLPAQIYLFLLTISEKYNVQEAKMHDRNDFLLLSDDIKVLKQMEDVVKDSNEESTFMSNNTAFNELKNKKFACGFFSYFTRQCEFVIKPDPEEKEEDELIDDGESLFQATKDNEFYKEEVENISDPDNDQVKVVYFFVHPSSFKVSKNNIDQFFTKIDRTSPTTKLKGFLEELSLFYSEVKFKCDNIDEKNDKTGFNYQDVDIFNFILACLINLTLLLCLNDGNFKHDYFYYFIVLLSVIQIATNVHFLYVFFKSKYKYIASLAKERLGIENEEKLSFLEKLEVKIFQSAFNSEINLLYLNLLIPLICLMSSNATILYPLQLLSVAKFVPTIGEIVLAFKLTFMQILAMIGFLAILILFYANIGFYFMVSEFNMSFDAGEANVCNSLLTCFLIYFNFGIRSGGGIGDIISPVAYSDTTWFWVRFITDMIFYITVILLVMNMINGIIISTFSSIREENENKTEDQDNKCFICSLSRVQFENRKIPFSEHRALDHNFNNYIKFFISLKLTDEKELNSDQSYILNCIREGEIAFFPIGKSAKLGRVDEEDNEEGS